MSDALSPRRLMCAVCVWSLAFVNEWSVREPNGAPTGYPLSDPEHVYAALADGMRVRHASGHPDRSPFATTTIRGTLYCSWHAVDAMQGRAPEWTR